MYLKLLDEAVREEQGMQPAEPECTADLTVTANIDKAYVERGEERMDLYRRMAAIRSQSDADDLLDEMVTGMESAQGRTQFDRRGPSAGPGAESGSL